MQIKWTDAQRSAIEVRDMTLLVSAAAGSGKTAVLTERVVSSLCREKEPADINRMLIATFTKAAAGELKSRISASLSSALSLDPTNRHLARQLASAPSAQISTIDSLCYSIVRKNFDKLGIPCTCRMADSAETAMLKSGVMNAMFDSLYSDENSQPFKTFTDIFISDNDDALPDIFIRLYDRLCTYAKGPSLLEDFSRRAREEKELPFFKTVYGKSLKDFLRGFVDAFITPVERYSTFFDTSKKSSAKLAGAYSAFLDLLYNVRHALEKDDYEAAKKAFCVFPAINMNGVSRTGDPEEELYRGLIYEMRDSISYIRDEFFLFSEKAVRDIFVSTADVLHMLYTLLSDFDAEYSREKLRRKLLDYSDVERMCLRLLCENGEPTETAKAVGGCYDEIYIDEYQDINDIQDTIFRMLASGGATRFMVGDIKQSIYGFRGADPSVFAGYRAAFPAYHMLTRKKSATIFLSENFRCSSPVIEVCNAVFSVLMNNTFSDVKYLPEDNLVFSRGDGACTKPVDIAVINTAKGGAKELDEPQYVASRIAELIRGGVSPDDIVILLRKKSRMKLYEDALGRMNIPCSNPHTKGFFDNPEILLVMCILNVIDNPYRDIYLAGALRSPVFGFTLEELECIRAEKKDGYLFNALREYAHTHESAKCEYFFSLTDELRSYSRNCPIDSLLWYIYSRTGLTASAYSEDEWGTRRADNLRVLYEYARKFEQGSFKGLYNFIGYIEKMRETDDAQSASQITGGSVRIMTIHASKGLEFPVVFLCDTASPLRARDDSSDIIIDPQLGAGILTPAKSGIAHVDGIIRRTVRNKSERDGVSEEMRILYVAMTRARERLIITARTNTEELMKNCEIYSSLMSPYVTFRMKNTITMILSSLMSSPSAPYKLTLINEEEGEKYMTARPSERTQAEQTPTLDSDKTDEYEKIFVERFAFRYPYSASASIPAKMSVSALYPSVLDETEDISEKAQEMKEIPDFMRGKLKPSAAERGTATHVFMQFCDLAAAEKSIENETDRLIRSGFIPEDYREKIDMHALAFFFRSELWEQMRAAKSIHRETRFNIELPAEMFTQDCESKTAIKGESVLVQGVIDCFFERNDGKTVLVDYKTDGFSREQLSNPEECERILRERHSSQLHYYAEAIKRLTGHEPIQTLIYSFALGKSVDI